MERKQFFNDDLFADGQSHAAYAKYVSSLPTALPDSILRINRGMLPDSFFVDPESAIYLHDARITAVASVDDSLRLALRVDHNDVHSQLTLIYSGVSRFHGVPEVLLKDVPDSGLMCHEITVLAAGGFNHKMLFASSDILSTDFQSLAIRLSPLDS